jgi:hypothetical protein
MILRINVDFFNNFVRLIFVMERQYAYCEAGTELKYNLIEFRVSQNQGAYVRMCILKLRVFMKGSVIY